MYINIGANNGSEKLYIYIYIYIYIYKTPLTSGKLIKAVYASYVYVYIFFVQISQIG